MCSQPQFTVFAQWDPTAEGKVVFSRLQGFNFGLKSAVLWFNRLAEFIQRAAVCDMHPCARAASLMTTLYLSRHLRDRAGGAC